MSKNLFNSIQVKRPPSNWFNLSYDHKLSLKMGWLVPTHVQECIPGDTFKCNTQILARFAPLLAPVMHKVDIYTHYFFVPNRIIWKNWEKFITGNQKPEDVPAFPFLSDEVGSALTLQPGSLGDYLGLPTGVPLTDKVSAIPFIAYQKIWQEYYRDQNLQDLDQTFEILGMDGMTLKDGNNNSLKLMLTTLKRRAWRHDYFTSALPFAQKGEAVKIPLTLDELDLPVEYIRDHPDGGNFLGSWKRQIDGIGGSGNLEALPPHGITREESGHWLNYDPADTLRARGTSDAQLGGTINDLRTAFRLQTWLEKNARGGTRYVESILMHFGVHSSDKRLQRPEYIGGVMQPMVISEVLQTSETAESPQANMAGHGVSVGGGRAFKYFCEEHGYIIGITSVMPRPAYFQGVPRHFNKFDRMLYYWSDFANLGEQEIKNSEIYYDPSDGLNNDVFGYTPRYSEYRYNSPRVSGDFRTSLDYWHMGRKFEDRPYLNSNFIAMKDEEVARCFPIIDSSEDHIYMHIFHDIKARRLMPKYATPML